jgi:putative membrane protein
VSCLITVVVTSIATALNGVDWAASTSDMLLVWLRGIIALTLLAVASAAVTLATHSGPIAGVVMGVVYVIEATVTTLGTVLGWDSHAYGWLPLQSIVSAVGVSNTAAYGTMAGMLLCVGWAGLATIIGLGRVKTYNL